jgi:ribosomal protein S14
MRKIYHKLNRNFYIKQNYKNQNIHYIFLKALLKEFINIPILTMQLTKLSYKKSIMYSKFRMRCLLSNRVRSTFKKFMLSRMILKKLALNGYIVGMKKAS